MSERDLILEGLRPLFEKAEQEGLWFYCNYQGLWFSPEKLKEYQSNGQFVWGAVNWQLRDPNEKLSEMERQRSNIDKDISSFKSTISR